MRSLRGFGDETLGHTEGDGVRSLPRDLGTEVGDGKAEAVGEAAVLAPESAAAKVLGELGEDGDPYLASALWLVSTFFSRSSVIFLPAMLCVSKVAVRFSTTAALRCAVPLITPSLMFWAVWEILPRIQNFESP